MDRIGDRIREPMSRSPKDGGDDILGAASDSSGDTL